MFVSGLMWSSTRCMGEGAGVFCDCGSVAVGVFCGELEWFCTSSFSTRPSLPVPSISSIFNLRSLIRCRTAGVASEACFPGCRCAFGCSFDSSVGRAWGTSGVDEPSTAASFVSFLPTSSSCSSCASFLGVSFSASLSGPSFRRASSAGEISLCISMSTRGFECQSLAPLRT
jgi:hypothetical protein